MFRPPIRKQKVRLGEVVMVGWGVANTRCKVVKTTRKGFNFLILATNRMYLQRHCYQRGMLGKEYPKRGNFNLQLTVHKDLRIMRGEA